MPRRHRCLDGFEALAPDPGYPRQLILGRVQAPAHGPDRAGEEPVRFAGVGGDDDGAHARLSLRKLRWLCRTDLTHADLTHADLSRASHVEAAVDPPDLPGDVGGCVSGQEVHHSGAAGHERDPAVQLAPRTFGSQFGVKMALTHADLRLFVQCWRW